MIRIVALVVVLAALLAAPAAALAQSNPFLQEGQQQAPQLQQPSGPPPPAPVEDRSDEDGDGVGPGVAIGIALITVLLIGGIWFAITRDARRAAPARRRAHAARTSPDAQERGGPGARGRHPTRSSGGGRRLSKQERERRKRGRAR